MDTHVKGPLASHRFPATLFCMAFLALAACDNSGGGPQVSGESAENTDSVTMTGGALSGNSLSDAALAEIEAAATFTSNFAAPNSAGTFSSSLTPAFTGSIKDASGYGFAYEVNRIGTELGAQAGIIPGSVVGTLPLGGFGVFQGPWQMAEIGKTDGEGREFGEPQTMSGVITLRADFDFGTLEGEDDDLLVRGRFSGAVLSGSVFHEGSAADLTGRIGTDRAIGAFHGTDSERAFSGGFYTSR